jgi:hypothetical protein
MNKLENILDADGIRACLYELVKQDGGKEVAVAFSIYVVEPFYFEIKWRAWATNWMNGSDRTAYAATYAANATYAATYAANAAYAATYATATYATYATATYAATYAAANATYAAAYAAANATYAKQVEERRQTEILRKLIRGMK